MILIPTLALNRKINKSVGEPENSGDLDFAALGKTRRIWFAGAELRLVAFYFSGFSATGLLN